MAIEFRLDKTKLEVTAWDKIDPNEDLEFWLSQPPIERLRALEFLRQQTYGNGTPPRLQRVLEISKSQ